MGYKVIGRLSPQEMQARGMSPSSDAGGYKKYTQKAGDVLDALGLGAIKNTLGGAYELQRGVRMGLGDTSGYYDEKKRQNIENPFLREKDIKEYDTGETGIKAITSEKGSKKLVTEGTKQTAGLASWAVPVSKGPMAAKIVASAGAGALSEFSQDDATPESIKNAALISGAMPPVFAAGGKVMGAIGNEGKKFIASSFKLNPTDAKTLKEAGIDFADEISKKDLPIIAKMRDPNEIVEYFMKKDERSGKVVDEFLRDNAKEIPMKKVLSILYYAKKSSRKGYFEGESAGKITEAADTFVKNTFGIDSYDELAKMAAAGKTLPGPIYADPVEVNHLRRAFNTIGKSAYTATGYPDLGSKRMTKVARSLGNLLEDAAEGYKKVNKTNMLYNAAYDAIVSAVSSFEKSPPILQRAAGPAFGVPLVIGLAAGNPLAGLLAGTSLVATGKLQNPSTKIRLANKAINVGKTGSTVPSWLKDIIKKGTTIGAGRTGAMFGK